VIVIETEADSMKVMALKALEHLLSRNMYKGTEREEDYARLGLRLLDALAEDPISQPFLLANLAHHPDPLVRVQARLTLVYIDGGIDVGTFEGATNELRGKKANPEIASDREKYEAENVREMPSKGYHLAFLDSNAFKLFEESLTEELRMLIKRNLALNPETPDALIEMLKWDSNQEMRASALENERRSKEDMEYEVEVPPEELARQIHHRGMTALQYAILSAEFSEHMCNLIGYARFGEIANEIGKVEKAKEGGSLRPDDIDRVIARARQLDLDEVAMLIEIDEGRAKVAPVDVESAKLYDASVSLYGLLSKGDVSEKAYHAFLRADSTLLVALSSPGAIDIAKLERLVERAGEFTGSGNSNLDGHYDLLKESALSLREPPAAILVPELRDKEGGGRATDQTPVVRTKQQ
jgi:hypothetical protein